MAKEMKAIESDGRGQERKQTRILVTLLVFVICAHVNEASARPKAGSGDVVIEWNQQLIDTVRAGLHPSGIRVERSYAMLHAAMFDAVNSIERNYTPFRFEVRASAGASAEAAAAQAAHDVLTALYPARSGVYDEALAAFLNSIPAGRARQGTAVGAAIAAQVIAWRVDDGWGMAGPLFPGGLAPGEWRSTPPAFSPAAFTQYPLVEPFAILGPLQFLAPTPPALATPEYAVAFNEAKVLGELNSAFRTPDQTLAAQMHASIGTVQTPNTVWNGVARDVSLGANLGLSETARLFALLNVAFHDALQVSFMGKYVHGLWRPITAIRLADQDSNPATVADPAWMPLLNAPPYPTYPGNAAALSAASARVLALVMGRDDVSFQVQFSPSIVRTYAGFWEFAQEQANSRVWGGIHFSFDSIASQESSTALVDWLMLNYMLPR
jgi:hypothetical protein